MQLTSRIFEVRPNKRIYNGRALLTPDMVVRLETSYYCLKPTIEEIKDAYYFQWRVKEIKSLACSLADFICKPL